MPASPATFESFHLGPWHIDLIRREARADDDAVDLSANEVAVLRYLYGRDAPAPRDQILQEALGYAPGVRSRALDMAVSRLRQKLPADTDLVCSKRGVGLWLAEASAPPAPPAPGGRPDAPRGAGSGPYLPRPAIEDRVQQLVEDWRVVTLIGPAGVGKSRIAGEVARRWPGCVVVRVGADGPSGTRTADALATALGAQRRDPAALAAALVARGAPVVLDDADVSWSASRALAAELAPARVVCTSRRPLEVEGEATCDVPPMAPETAVRFLSERAAASRWNHGVSDDVLAEVAAALDGLPRALELAVHEPAGLAVVAERLRREARPLGLGDAEARSLDELAPSARALLVALARVGAPLTAEECVDWRGDDAGRQLQELADRSLIVRDGGGWRPLRTTLAALGMAPDAVPDASFDAFLVRYAGQLRRTFHRAPREVLPVWDRLAPVLVDAVERLPVPHLRRYASAVFDIVDALGPFVFREELVRRARARAPDHPLARATALLLEEGTRDPEVLAPLESGSLRDRLDALALRAGNLPPTVDPEAAEALAERLPLLGALEARRAAAQARVMAGPREGYDDALAALADTATRAHAYPVAHVRTLCTLGLTRNRAGARGALTPLRHARQIADAQGMTRWSMYLRQFEASVVAAADPAQGRAAYLASAKSMALAGETDRPALIRAAALSYVLDDLDGARRHLADPSVEVHAMWAAVYAQLQLCLRARDGDAMAAERLRAPHSRRAHQAERAERAANQQALDGWAAAEVALFDGQPDDALRHCAEVPQGAHFIFEHLYTAARARARQAQRV